MTAVRRTPTLGSLMLALLLHPVVLPERVAGAQALDSARTLALLANNQHLFGLGLTGQLGDSRWAVHGRAAGGPVTAAAVLGVRAVLIRTGRAELGGAALIGAVTCAGFLDGPSPICEVPTPEARLGAVLALDWLIAIGDSRRWRIGPEVAYWGATSRPENPARGMWTVGLVAHRRLQMPTPPVRPPGWPRERGARRGRPGSGAPRESFAEPVALHHVRNVRGESAYAEIAEQ